jgi:hypothetical protein
VRQDPAEVRGIDGTENRLDAAASWVGAAG